MEYYDKIVTYCSTVYILAKMVSDDQPSHRKGIAYCSKAGIIEQFNNLTFNDDGIGLLVVMSPPIHDQDSIDTSNSSLIALKVDNEGNMLEYKGQEEEDHGMFKVSEEDWFLDERKGV